MRLKPHNTTDITADLPRMEATCPWTPLGCPRAPNDPRWRHTQIRLSENALEWRRETHEECNRISRRPRTCSTLMRSLRQCFILAGLFASRSYLVGILNGVHKWREGTNNKSVSKHSESAITFGCHLFINKYVPLAKGKTYRLTIKSQEA